MESAAKDHIKYLTRNSIDLFTDALNEGNVQYFFDNLPSTSSGFSQEVDHILLTKHTQYRHLVDSMFSVLLAKDTKNKINLTRDDLILMADYLIGKTPTTSNKFTSFIKHHNLKIKPVKINSQTVQGFTMHMKANNELLTEWGTNWKTPKAPPKLKTVPTRKE